MSVCPACQCHLTEDDRRAGRCPSCESILPPQLRTRATFAGVRSLSPDDLKEMAALEDALGSLPEFSDELSGQLTHMLFEDSVQHDAREVAEGVHATVVHTSVGDESQSRAAGEGGSPFETMPPPPKNPSVGAMTLPAGGVPPELPPVGHATLPSTGAVTAQAGDLEKQATVKALPARRTLAPPPSNDDPLATKTPSRLGGPNPTAMRGALPPPNISEVARSISGMWGNAAAAASLIAESGLRGSQVTIRPRVVYDPLRVMRDSKAEHPAGGVDDADYELLKQLGEGGMGVVYSARQTSVDRKIAIKMLKRSTANDMSARGKFLAEAAVTGELDHPNIVPVYDLGVDDAGGIFYSMKLVRGKPWSELISQKTRSENLDILLRTSDAIAFAHDHGVIHRDLKPENVMLGDYGEVVVMDWGLAAGVDADSKAPLMHGPESNGGTPAYMAPEMAAGPVDRIGKHSDIYLLGAILWEIIGGVPPHDGQSVLKCLFAAGQNRIVPIKERGELADVAMKAMATRPEDRYESVRAFQKGLRDYLSHQESVLLATHAEEHFNQALQSHRYDGYAQALFGFQQAIELWPQNQVALRAAPQVQLAYAEEARAKGDFDLALSLLDGARPEHVALRTEVEKAQAARAARDRRVRTLRNAVVVLAVAVAGVMGVAFVWVNAARAQAETSRIAAVAAQKTAEDERVRAEQQKQVAVHEREAAVAAQKQAELEKTKAEAARKQEEKAREAERAQRLAAEEAQRKEQLSKEREIVARQAAVLAEGRAISEGYVAKVGLAAAKISENSFRLAETLLHGCAPALRRWEWGRLHYLCRLDLATLLGHTQRVDAVAFTPHVKGGLLATAGWDGKILLYNASTKQLLKTLEHAPAVRTLAFSPDGGLLASGGDDGRVRLWNPATGEAVKALEGHSQPVLTASFSADGKQLVSGASDDTARVWDVASGKTTVALVGHSYWVWTAAFTPDGRRAVTGGEDGRMILWRLAAAEAEELEELTPLPPDSPLRGLPRALPLREQRVHPGGVRTLAVTKNGNVISGGDDKLIRVWNSEITKVEREWTGHGSVVRTLSISPHGPWLASGGNDNTVRTWHLLEGFAGPVLRGHSGSVTSVCWMGGGDLLASGAEDRAVKLWDRAEYHEDFVLEGHSDAVFAGAFSPDGGRAATAGRDSSAIVWNARDGRREAVFAEGHSDAISFVQLSADGKTALTAGRDGTIRFWDPQSGKELQVLKMPEGLPMSAALSWNGLWVLAGNETGKIFQFDRPTGKVLKTYKQHVSAVTALAWSRDDAQFVSGDENALALVWDRDALKAKTKYPETHSRRITALAFSPDGGTVYSGSLDATVMAWNSKTAQNLATYSQPTAPNSLPAEVRAMALSQDGTRLVTGASDGRLRVWDAKTHKLLSTLEGAEGMILSVSLSNDAGRALAATLDGEMWLWHVADKRGVRLRDRKEIARYAALSPDGRYALAANTSVATWWNVESEEVLGLMAPHGVITGVGFTPDDKELVTAGFDGAIKVWDLATASSVRKRIAHLDRINSLAIWPPPKYVRHEANARAPFDRGVAPPAERPGAAPAGADAGRASEGNPANLARPQAPPPQAAPGAAEVEKRPALFATASDDGRARVWGAAGLKLLAESPKHPDRVRGVCFSPDGTKLATACNDGLVRIWQVDGLEAAAAAAIAEKPLPKVEPKLLHALAGHRWWALAVAFSPDGKTLFSASQDNTVRVWNVGDGTAVRTLEGHTAGVTSLAASPDGSRVYSGSGDATVRVWDWADGNEVLTLSEPRQEVLSVAVSPGGLGILAASRDQTGILWRATPWEGGEAQAPAPARAVGFFKSPAAP